MIFLDTSGLFSFHHRREPHHEEAKQLMASEQGIVTHNYVLAEFVPLCQSRGLSRTGVLDCLTILQKNPMIDVVFVDPPLHEEAMQLLVQRQDKDWSLCDAVSFVLMSERNITEALTTDHHFEQAGFIRLLKP